MAARESIRRLRAVSLFSNCGAGDLGFARAGFSFEVMAELDERRLQVALLNHPGTRGVGGDLRATLPEVVEAYRQAAGHEAPALLAACPPCQGMSSARSARGSEVDPDVGSRDVRNLLVAVIATAVAELRPRVVVVENVQAFLTRQVRHPASGVGISAADFLIGELGEEYQCYPLLTDLADYGVPQRRRRAFLTFVRKSEAACAVLQRRGWAPYPWPSHGSGGGRQPHVSLREALETYGLPALDAGSPEAARSDVRLHSVPVWPPGRYKMIETIPAGSGGSAWENDSCTECGTTAHSDAAADCGACGAALPRPVVWDVDVGRPRLVKGFRSSYRRMATDRPASAITTASGHVGSDRTVHPWENRVLSPLECALLQTLPVSFEWGDALERWGHTNVRAMIGEAVPPLFTEKHGRILRRLLRATPPRVALPLNDSRVEAARRALARRRTPLMPSAT